MQIRKKGSRRIVVDGEAYLWRIRQKATYSQSLGETGMTVTVQHTEGREALVLGVGRPRIGNWLGVSSSPVTPADVEKLIRRALASGWQPREGGEQDARRR